MWANISGSLKLFYQCGNMGGSMVTFNGVFLVQNLSVLFDEMEE